MPRLNRTADRPPPLPQDLAETGFLRDSLLVTAAGIAWIAIFFVWYFRQDLSIGGGILIPRLDVLLQTPEILAANFQRDPDSSWANLSQRIDLIGVAACVLIGALGMGRLALRGLRTGAVLNSPAGFAFSWGLGLSFWSLFVLGCGLAGWLNRWLFAACLLAVVLAEAVLTIARRGPRAGRGEESEPVSRGWILFTLAAVSPVLLAMALGAMLPPTDFDVNEYHLEGPKEFFQNGRIGFLPHNVYTSFPFLTEMLSLSAMVVRGDWYRGALAGQLVLAAFALITALGVFALAKELCGGRAAWLAVLVWLTTPWTYRISIIAYAEGGLSCYLLLSCLALVLPRGVRFQRASEGDVRFQRASEGGVRFQRASESGVRFQRAEMRNASDFPSRHAGSVPHVVLTGLLAGSAAACKYPGVLTVVIPIGLGLVWCSNRRTESAADADASLPLRRLPRTAAAFSLGVLITFGPWLIKNAAETGNPVYPLLWSVFGGDSFDAETNARWTRAHGPPTFLLEQPSGMIPDLFAQLREVMVVSLWQSPLLFALAPLSLLGLRRRRSLGMLWLYLAWLFGTWLWLTHRIDRFWIPLIPVASVLAGGGADVLWQRLAPGVRMGRPAFAVLAILFLAALGLGATYNVAFITTTPAGYNAYLRDLDLARHDPGVEPATVRLLHAAGVDHGSRVLYVGEANVFPADFPCLYNTAFDDSIFQEWFGEPQAGQSPKDWPLRPAPEIRERLRRERVTHVCVHWGEIARYRAKGSYGYTDFVHPSRFRDLVDAGLLVRTPFVADVDWSDVGPSEQQAVEDWTPELRRSPPNGNTFRRIEVYRVAE